MARTKFGFQISEFSPTFFKKDTKIKSVAANYIKTNTDEAGVVSDPNVYLEAINILLPYADDISVANKIADYRNSALKLEKKTEDAENTLVLFKDDFERGRAEIVRSSYDDPLNLFEPNLACLSSPKENVFK